MQMPTTKPNTFAHLEPLIIVQGSLKTKINDINILLTHIKPQGHDHKYQKWKR